MLRVTDSLQQLGNESLLQTLAEGDTEAGSDDDVSTQGDCDQAVAPGTSDVQGPLDVQGRGLTRGHCKGHSMQGPFHYCAKLVALR